MVPRFGRLSRTPWRYLKPGVHQVFWRDEFSRVLVGGGFYLRLGRAL